jgi:beta-glucosidase
VIERNLVFPKGFMWGTASSSYQIEGGHDADGKGWSVWDTFCSDDASRIADGKSGQVSSDHYHRYREDIQLMGDLGYPNYRFSISWPRVVPQGTGGVNPAGLDFYDRLVDELMAKAITPCVTLFHWDLPQALQDVGGWSNRSTAEAFATYGEEVVRRLGDRVRFWMTLNEPWVHALEGHFVGNHAPGLTNLSVALQAAHHILLAHGMVIPRIRAMCPEARIGLVNNLEWVEPASDTDQDLAAAKRHDGAYNRWFMDPVYFKRYPEDMWSWYADALPRIEPDDLNIIAEPMDFLGVNYYTRRIIAHDPSAGFLHTRQVFRPFVSQVDYANWEDYPEGLYLLLKRVKREYQAPVIFITENGSPSDYDEIVNGTHRDLQRIEYIRRHAAAVWQAIQDGVDVRGYFVWGFLDDFEWNYGFTKRFGLVHVDFDTLERRVKESGVWYASVCRNNGFEVCTR